ncbi:MAG: protein kinase domain-containing protein [Microbacterium sp.]
MSTPSTLIADRYRLVKMLGAGGMGLVWQASDERLQRPVALKLLRTQPELSDRERELATERAMREARITAGLHHPHAVTVFDVVEHDGQPCIVMQLIESTPLSVLLSEHGTLTPSETVRIAGQVGSALAAAHKMRIVHRDVKPGNILITADGSAMISDFGISHALGDTAITATGMIHGTPAYLAPEVARGLPTIFASDVFSLGSTMYAMLEGEPPFGSDKNAMALLHRVARGGHPPAQHAGPLAPMLRSMLAANPKRRPTMEDVVHSLAAIPDVTRTPARAAGPIVLPWLVDGASAAGDHANQPVADAATEPVQDVPTEPFRDVATEPIRDVATATAPDADTEPVQDADTEPVQDADTERIEDHETARFDAAEAEGNDDAPTQRVEAAAADSRTDALTELLGGGPPTAETERFGFPPGAAETAAPVSPRASAAESAPNRTGRLVALVGVLVLVGAVVLGAVLLLNPLRSTLGEAGEPRAGTTPVATPVAPTPSSSSPALEAEPEPEPAPEQEPAPEPAPEAPTPEERVIQTVAGYYSMLPGDLDSAWPLMTADYQENHAGGRGAYESFWSVIDGVEVSEVSASAADQAQATLTYFFSDGRVIREVTSYRLVDEGGVLKIAASDVLSSTQL